MQSSKYILFVAQDCNFQSRGLLIPFKEFTEACPKDYEILKKHSKSETVRFDGKKYEIDNLLVEKVIWKGNCGQPEKTEYSDLCMVLRDYANGRHICWWDEDIQVFNRKGVDWKTDLRWVEKVKHLYCPGFNHAENYCRLREELKDTLEDGFLVLEKTVRESL